jgi:soluble lytic murein transglycosylase
MLQILNFEEKTPLKFVWTPARPTARYSMKHPIAHKTATTARHRHKLALLLCAGLWPTIVQALIPDTTTPHALAAADLLDRVVNYQAALRTAQRKRFLAAERALRRGRSAEFRHLLTGLGDYPLYPYLRYQDLKQRLGQAGEKELAKFLDDYRDLPIADTLRRKLLHQSARQDHWQRFLAFYMPQRDARLQCHYANALLHTNQTQVAWPLIEKLWLSGQSRPRNCDHAFERWRAAGHLTAEQIWQRLTLVLAAGRRPLARYLVRSLPVGERKLAKLWIRLHHRPHRLARYQAMLVQHPHPMATTILIDTAKRLARKDPRQAAALWTALDTRDQVPSADHYAILQRIALTLAQRHQPDAETWFAVIPDPYLSTRAREWRIRAALRQSHWQTALDTIETLTPTQQISNRWHYWRARVLERTGQETAALEHYRVLAQRRSYYGFLAADRLGLPYTLSDRPHQPSASALFEVSQRPDIQRAQELYRLGRTGEARREWLRAIATLDDIQRADASKLAQLWGWAGQSILTMAGTSQRDDISLRFPLLYQQQILNYSQRERIDPAWIYGVIRRESAFAPDARSPKGAVGLMQLMPATAKDVSRSLKIRYRGNIQLTQADTNLALGTRYLRQMLKRFGGQTVLATAAYNAGARRTQSWLPADTTLDAERWIENIPFRETREYVTSVLAFTVIYAQRLGMKKHRLSEHMPAIPVGEALRKKAKDRGSA